jgi:hypothetical protein
MRKSEHTWAAFLDEGMALQTVARWRARLQHRFQLQAAVMAFARWVPPTMRQWLH